MVTFLGLLRFCYFHMNYVLEWEETNLAHDFWDWNAVSLMQIKNKNTYKYTYTCTSAVVFAVCALENSSSLNLFENLFHFTWPVWSFKGTLPDFSTQFTHNPKYPPANSSRFQSQHSSQLYFMGFFQILLLPSKWFQCHNISCCLYY